GTTFITATAGSREDFEAFARVAELCEIRPAIAKAFSVRDLGDAVEYLERGGHFGQVVLNLDF
ncbi:MAG TPA: zinc-binding dehydrogenase, partial [Steroidobacteraceae bacterium]|nr:zinc-binding dehydrogenase [Steroidobacteraceae bacterium]